MAKYIKGVGLIIGLKKTVEDVLNRNRLWGSSRCAQAWGRPSLHWWIAVVLQSVGGGVESHWPYLSILWHVAVTDDDDDGDDDDVGDDVDDHDVVVNSDDDVKMKITMVMLMMLIMMMTMIMIM